MTEAGFGSADITPPLGVELAGYFNKRFASGVRDPLRVRALALRGGDATVALLSFDLIGMGAECFESVRARLGLSLGLRPDCVLAACTHTHTAPCLAPLFEAEAAPGYFDDIVLPAVEDACRKAIADLGPFELRFGRTTERGLAFCRRYRMKDGRVMTNPPRSSADVAGPESEIDHAVNVLALYKGGACAGIAANINNHCDSTGGDMISADWPGWAERAMCEYFGRDVPVLILIGPEGNINHFDRSRSDDQCCPDEARRLGLAYARFIIEALEGAEVVKAAPLRAATESFLAPYRKATPAELERARRLAARKPDTGGKDMTSEDLARGHPYVDWLYARELLAFHERCGGREGERVEAAAVRVGECAIVGLPGEPFSQLGLAIKARSPFERTSVFALYGGMAGYIPPRECFGGGYEPLTTSLNRFAPEVAEMLVEAALKALHSLE
jgi:neutral ceramidase